MSQVTKLGLQPTEGVVVGLALPVTERKRAAFEDHRIDCRDARKQIEELTATST